MKKILTGLILSLIFLKAYAGQITVYAASDLVFAFDEILKIYKQKNPDNDIKVIFGSSGKGYHQIINGAPYDVYFSANMLYVKKLEEKGLTITKPKLYAVGRIVLWTRKDSGIDVSKGINTVLERNVKKIAIANWEHAPYGVAAKECLEHYKLFDKVKNRLIKGENISQTAQFTQIGASDVGFIALSLALSKKLSRIGDFYLLPQKCHKPILQGYAVLKNSSNNKEKLKTALRFVEFIQTKEAREIFNKYGFKLPQEESKN